MVRSMMSHSDLPIPVLGYALETAEFMMNQAPTKAKEGTPYGLWYRLKPILSCLEIYCCSTIHVLRWDPQEMLVCLILFHIP